MMPPRGASFPWATFAVNVSGAFGLCLVAVVLAERIAPTRYLRPLIGIGFFGAYTTFSTMALEGVRSVDAGHPGLTAVYWVVTLVAGQLAGFAGMVLAMARREARS